MAYRLHTLPPPTEGGFQTPTAGIGAMMIRYNRFKKPDRVTNPDSIADATAEATENGAKPVSKKLRIVRDDEGRPFGIAVDEATATAAVRSGDYPDTSIWSLPEVVRVLGGHEMALANAAKEVFPGATVAAVRPVQLQRGALDDELPF